MHSNLPELPALHVEESLPPFCTTFLLRELVVPSGQHSMAPLQWHILRMSSTFIAVGHAPSISRIRRRPFSTNPISFGYCSSASFARDLGISKWGVIFVL